MLLHEGGGGLVGRRRRHGAAKAKGSTSLLMVLVVSSAVLAIVPFRVTLAVGQSSIGIFFTAKQLWQLLGTHVSIDSLGIFADTRFTAQLVGTILNLNYNNTSGEACLVGPVGALSGQCSVAYPLKLTRYFAVKVQKLTVDITGANSSEQGLLGPFGNGPTFVASTASAVVQVRVVMLSTTISAYNAGATSTVDRYNETDLSSLNPAFTITFDRLFLDLFLDPSSNVATYYAAADMTVYQGLALMAEAAFLS
jgi:hypothetical protein